MPNPLATASTRLKKFKNIRMLQDALSATVVFGTTSKLL